MKRALPAVLFFCHALLADAQGGLNIFLNVQHATCGSATGGITGSAWGGVPPYTYVWTPAPPSGQGTLVLQDLPAGMYSVTVTDAQGATASAEATVIETPDLFPPFAPAQAAWSCAPGCNGSFNHYLPLSGATMPYTVTFDPPGPTGGASPNGLYFSSLCAGETYMVTVSDANGCTGTVSGLEVVGPMDPEILNLVVTASCPGGSNGAFVVEFTDADSIFINPSGIQQWSQAGNMLMASNLAAGSYLVYVSISSNGAPPPGTSSPWCTATFAIEVPESTEPCGTVSGIVYADLDGDCMPAGADVGLPFRPLTIDPGGQVLLTGADGSYATALFYGAYAFDAAIDGYASSCITLPAAFALDAGASAATFDVPMEPLEGPDARAFLSAGVHRPGFPVSYYVSVQNDGPFAFDAMTLELAYDPLLTLVTAEGAPSVVGPGQLSWALPGLAPFATAAFTVELSVPPTASLIGTMVNATVSVTPDPADADPSNDAYAITRTIVGAYDPNDKLAQTSSRLSEAWFFLDADAYVDFTIRFQNTGTAEAINVHLTDTISPLFDLLSIEVLGASHPFTAALLPGRVLRFDFTGIMLPDSAADPLGSQGYASFRLKPIPGLAPGAELANTADIYFDFNESIRTNTAVLGTDYTVGLAEQGLSLLLRPNPVRDELWVAMPAGAALAEVVALDGRVVISRSVRDAVERLTVTDLRPGAYLLRVTTASGAMGQERFVKQ
jgi:uncharacterized repeat protein (TIGR01451 family)